MLDGTLVPRLRRSGWEESLYCGRWQARNGGDANWQRSGASHRPTRQRPIRSFRCDRTPPRSAASSQPGPGSGQPSPLSAGIHSHSCPCRQLTLINASLGSGASGDAYSAVVPRVKLPLILGHCDQLAGGLRQKFRRVPCGSPPPSKPSPLARFNVRQDELGLPSRFSKSLG